MNTNLILLIVIVQLAYLGILIYLDWYFDGEFSKQCGTPDGFFGDNTLKWTKKFQEEVIGKGEGDGICGNKTFEAAKNVVKK